VTSIQSLTVMQRLEPIITVNVAEELHIVRRAMSPCIHNSVSRHGTMRAGVTPSSGQVQLRGCLPDQVHPIGGRQSRLLLGDGERGDEHSDGHGKYLEPGSPRARVWSIWKWIKKLMLVQDVDDVGEVDIKGDREQVVAAVVMVTVDEQAMDKEFKDPDGKIMLVVDVELTEVLVHTGACTRTRVKLRRLVLDHLRDWGTECETRRSQVCISP
jgi:hypothetical protein